MDKPRILIVEDDNDWQQIYQSSLSESGYEIIGTRKISEALALLQKETFDVVITDLKMLGGSEVFSGFGVLKQAKLNNPAIQVIVITGFGSADHAMRAMGSGAYDYIIKGPDLRKKLALTVKGALEFESLKLALLRQAHNDDVQMDANPIIANSPSMEKLFEQIAEASENEEINVLIQGESGTGKRLIAQTIHLRSARRNNPFLVVDCGRLLQSVLEEEVFGYEAGTSSGGAQGRPGKFEQVQNGTIFLDGLSNLDVQVQRRLIGVICDKQVERIGGKAPINIKARIIASTDKDLKSLNQTGHFDSKLLYAFRACIITVPPLRERKERDDILALAAMFLTRYSKNPEVTFSKEAREVLNNHDYPGNLSELESIVKHALYVSRGSTKILPEHLYPELLGLNRSKDEEKITPVTYFVAPLKRGVYEPSVFISYAWGDAREEIVSEIDKSLQERGLKIIRDKRDLPFKGSISEFMTRIGRGNCVIVVISDKYLRSENCMFELVEIAENKQFSDRIFPIILSDAKIFKPIERLEYVEHWEKETEKLNEKMKSLRDQSNLQGIREDLDNYARFRQEISRLTSTLKDMNVLTPEKHRESKFSELYEAIERRMKLA